eukprot:TRINITY_DN648_c0_g1_i3.p1 TRINITY_DN648_c0_g1~~TRINITY_DN648_c0_g1_i3.p1  ORF type:complete len:306 (+),score=95.60 TRINITY_DN648_c0_g1_i3:88-1005(+)
MPVARVTCSAKQYNGTHEWNFRNDETLETFRKTVQAKFGVDPGLQRLMVAGSEMTGEAKQMVDFKLGGKTVTLMVRLAPVAQVQQPSSAESDDDAAVAASAGADSVAAAGAELDDEAAAAAAAGTMMSEEELILTAIEAEYDAATDTFIFSTKDMTALETSNDNVPIYYLWRLDAVYRVDHSLRTSVSAKQRAELRVRFDWGQFAPIEGSSIRDYCVFGLVPGASSEKFEPIVHPPPTELKASGKKGSRRQLLFSLQQADIDSMALRVLGTEATIEYFAIGQDEGCQKCHKRDRPGGSPAGSLWR